MFKIICLCICVMFTISLGDGSQSQKENNSAEIIGGPNLKPSTLKCQPENDKDCDIDYISMNSNETGLGPLDSHEAMNTREFKASASTSASRTSSHRNKRNINVDKKKFRNMVLGAASVAARRPPKPANSRNRAGAAVKRANEAITYQDDDEQQLTEDETNSDEDADADDEVREKSFQSDASELLLELMVRIAAHPQQWNEVHTLLQKIDHDLSTSKKLIAELQTTKNERTTSIPNQEKTTTNPLNPANNFHKPNATESTRKLVILLENGEAFYSNSSSNTKETNLTENNNKNWPNLENFEKSTTPWNHTPKNTTSTSGASSTGREFEFSYHRVTGLPLPYRSNYDKTRARNAYIAVSVIAPKTRNDLADKQDNLLENELHQLKPWSHEENLSNMENIRKKWWIQQEQEPQSSDKKEN